MPSFASNNQAVVAAASEVVTSALMEIGVVAQGEQPAAEDSAWGLEKLQRTIDQWNARREVVFSTSFNLYTLKPNHGPHTIGSGGDFDVPVRPVRIESAAFILNAGSANPVDAWIDVSRDDDWWAANPLKSLISSIVTDLYYDAAGGLGNLNFFPICNIANPVRLQTWASLSQAVSLNSKLGFVQGYWEAIVADLAVRLAPSFQATVSPELREQWNRAMRIIEANNNKPPRIETNAGMPSSGRGGRPDFNFLTGMRE